MNAGNSNLEFLQIGLTQINSMESNDFELITPFKKRLNHSVGIELLKYEREIV